MIMEVYCDVEIVPEIAMDRIVFRFHCLHRRCEYNLIPEAIVESIEFLADTEESDALLGDVVFYVPYTEPMVIAGARALSPSVNMVAGGDICSLL